MAKQLRMCSLHIWVSFIASPSRIRRIEAGIPDFSVDMDVSTNPFEVGLGRLVDTRADHDYVGKSVLQRIARQGPLRRLVQSP